MTPQELLVAAAETPLDDPRLVFALEAIAHERAENVRLREERERLKVRIAEEDARLSRG